MNRQRYWMVGLFCVVFLSTFSPAIAQRFDYDEIIEESFDVRSGLTLFVDADLGSIEVIGGRGNEVHVRVIKGVDDVSERRAEEYFARYDVSFRESSRGIEVEGKYDRPSFWRNNRLRVIYEISIPEVFNVDLHTSGGSIAIERIDGEANIRTSGGSLSIEAVSGPVEARTSGGSITADGVGAPAKLNTSGGSITVRDAAGSVDAKTSGGSISVRSTNGDVYAHTSGGSIHLMDIAGAVDASTSGGSVEAEILGQPERDVTLKTSGGTVTLHLDAGVRADISAHASGGRVRTDLPISVRGEIQRSRLEGTLNGGGPNITLRSSGGSVNIRER